MARPKKLSTGDMLQIVNDYYESCGDAERLKCSLLEEYAVSRGFDVKAYDFRRNVDVRRRIDELRDLALLPTEAGSIAYKSLDIDALISQARNREALKNSLLELDETWRRIYDRAVALSHKNDVLVKEVQQIALDFEQQSRLVADLLEKVAALRAENKNMLLENRYLKKMIKSHLYPAIANEILKNENVLAQVDTEVAPTAMDVLTEPDVPLPFSASVSADRQMLSREESILTRIEQQINGG